MTLHTTTRVPVDDEYAALVGKAVYVFAYYEWTIVWIMDFLESGFVSEYIRKIKMTSVMVANRFGTIIDKPATSFDKVSRPKLLDCLAEFERLLDWRNALLHAHPITDSDGAQRLNCQSIPSAPLPDVKWPAEEVEKIITEFDAAACRAGEILDKLRT